jgi:hypothetical protein
MAGLGGKVVLEEKQSLCHLFPILDRRIHSHCFCNQRSTSVQHLFRENMLLESVRIKSLLICVMLLKNNCAQEKKMS